MPRLPRSTADFAQLPTEAAHPRAAKLDTMAPEAIAALMLGEEAKAVRAAQARADVIGRAARLVADRLAAGGRLVYVGAGTSGRLGTLDAVECVPTFGVPPSRLVPIIAGGPSALTRSVEGAEDNVRDGEQRLRRVAVGPADVVCCMAASGDDAVRARRARVRALPPRRDHPRHLRRPTPTNGERVADVVIALETGPEVIAGLDPAQGGNRDEDHAERDVDRRVRAAGQDLRRPDGRRAPDEREAVGARDPDRAHAVGARRCGGAQDDREGGRARQGRAGHAPRGRERRARQGAAGQAQGIAAGDRRGSGRRPAAGGRDATTRAPTTGRGERRPAPPAARPARAPPPHRHRPAVGDQRRRHRRGAVRDRRLRREHRRSSRARS